ncbi:hypothetical protein SU69_05420 [Thermosipho melanesiensis]|uniref:DUF2922 domain-containing protein n=2 Tax=Thermosipho melanesiensis TaxID=46541 RepID=A6LLX0_THEM4|nr:DUF2922 domain-containing protein [Thermosipho melanesiensis]ABR30921.1 hypothetical protein Tmel_1061 [Thermosipho melanesiensis BI429]APT74038.1 hypothetical protein BW47_05670 [Thermosipho melanesiensis]OOC35966.1 hypothetical protein SU68_05480 [Thermosipho melanesiensis]OOC38105.1 hypothetical protein SU69_05420 [Thermosipho melanesiensis]OOC38235.1 hypothetical protein SU70_05430 [Thermosipho melanesiensis]
MKRLALVFRNQTDGKSLRINIPEPPENINQETLKTDAQALIDNGLVPQVYVFDEARIVETNTNVLLDLIK